MAAKPSAIVVALLMTAFTMPPKLIRPGTACAPDAVSAGTVCMDTYEASVWRVPESTGANAGLVRRIRLGTATQADLIAGGATPLGRESDDYAPCDDAGRNCTNDVFAVSLPSVIPSAFITWFQAQEACANSGKRLPTNAEWQVAANGTPDPGTDDGTTDCNIDDAVEGGAGAVVFTGSRSRCVSARGAYDMVGNLAELTADWVPSATACPGWGSFSDDAMCVGGASVDVPSPGVLVRGGAVRFGRQAGPLSVAESGASFSGIFVIGFRCAR